MNSKPKIGFILFQQRVNKLEETLRSFCLKNSVDSIFISKLERNKIKIDNELIEKISKIYQLPVERLKQCDLDIVDNIIDFPVFLPPNISEDQMKKLLSAIKDA